MSARVSLTSLMAGVANVRNEDGFPQESAVPQGQVIVTFNDGEEVEIGANLHEFNMAMAQLSVDASNSAPYGYCPHCSAEGVQRERRPGGNDQCSRGHVYPSAAAKLRR